MSNASMSYEVSQLKQDMAVVKTEMKTVSNDLTEIKRNQKELLEFMYQVRGGKAWLFGLLTIAGTIGALVTNAVTNLFK